MAVALPSLVLRNIARGWRSSAASRCLVDDDSGAASSAARDFAWPGWRRSPRTARQQAISENASTPGRDGSCVHARVGRVSPPSRRWRAQAANQERDQSPAPDRNGSSTGRTATEPAKRDERQSRCQAAPGRWRGRSSGTNALPSAISTPSVAASTAREEPARPNHRQARRASAASAAYSPISNA